MKSRSRRSAAPPSRRSSRSKARFLINTQTVFKEASDSSGSIISCHENSNTATSGPRAAGDSAADALRGAPSAAQQLHAAAVKCGICLEVVPSDSTLKAVMRAMDDGAGSSAGGKGCRHKFCIDCMRQYVTTQVQARQAVSCPAPGCEVDVPEEAVMQLLGDEPQLIEAYQEMQLESAMPADQRTYCPYPECGFMLERPADPEDYADKPLECPYCDKPFCVTCGIMGGHKGLSCAEFQKLPKKLHSAAGAGVFDLAQSKKWKRCPKCGHMVERNTGCDYMTCRCKAHFCYACGGSFKKGRCLCKGR